ncbi:MULTISPECIES: DUF2996 domain-containing protein [Prochlorococcus]|uniref:Type II secretory pathway n=1 Tax=Prochlorococcus marinus (strain SARG / CCMP1375 / SS120) TaxID=167539 RepID=Q7VBV1_PROMA|nr:MULTISPECIES: DUF2996 domain-containing protein [Prochlorococcus]AAQ00036.1 Uncharacterized protein Pro_0991 [Prochlorococcus marinus subsp. marinus str. CCMP1375]KGG13833.1 Type II secretory pathway [Prochlorococcus marinus str. LG]KGG18967.1 Type II secretory pathway [Prochlorococcus marinus str. SS2]KGG23494.1 Type II secretory pathway [Prochlorococcus marinus str. SS35]KGG32270.1 Type II secretory pathway [Prochlorococcus marinus str. SS51]
MENNQDLSANNPPLSPEARKSSQLEGEKSLIKKKPPKLEEKPFEEFVNKHLIPEISNSLSSKGISLESIILKKDQRPVVGGECWIVYGELLNGKRFWITFNSDDIKSTKNICLAESSSEAALLESFLIDEKKITLQLLTSRFMQRLNGQKWLGDN